MKRLLFIALLFVAFDSFSQPLNYTRIANRYRWISGMFDSALYVPRYNGTPSGVRVGENSAIDGAIAIDTANGRAYMYTGGAWVRLANYAELSSAQTWQQTLTAGSTLTGNNTIAGGGYNFTFGNHKNFTIDADSSVTVQAIAGSNQAYSLYEHSAAGSTQATMLTNRLGYGNILTMQQTGQYGVSVELSNTVSNGHYQSLRMDSTGTHLKPMGGDIDIDSIDAGAGVKAVRWNPATGKVTVADTTTSGTTYTAGPGLLLTANDFSVLTKRSITIDSDSLMLVNDSTGGAYHLYGRNIANRLGFYRPDTNYIANFSTMVRPLISLTTTGSSGAATYNSATGVFNIPEYAGGAGGDVNVGDTLSWIDVQHYGALDDGKEVSDAAISSGTAILTSATASFSADDVGKYIRVGGAGSGGIELLTTIAGYTNSTTVTLTNNASTTVSSQRILWGTDNTSFIQAAINAAVAGENASGTVFFKKANTGRYLVADSNQATTSQLYIPTATYSPSATNHKSIRLLGMQTQTYFIDYVTGQKSPSTGIIIQSMRNDSAYSILGSGSSSSAYGFHNWTMVYLENLTFRAVSLNGTTNIEPLQSGIDFQLINMCDLRNVIVQTESDNFNSVRPDTSTFGIRLPYNNNGGYVRLDNVMVERFNSGVVASENVIGDNVWINACYNGWEFVTGTHPSFIKKSLVEWCVNGIMVSGANPNFNFGLYVIETYPTDISTKWFNTVHDFYVNTGSPGSGNLNYYRVKGGTGVEMNGLTRNDAATTSNYVFTKFNDSNPIEILRDSTNQFRIVSATNPSVLAKINSTNRTDLLFTKSNVSMYAIGQGDSTNTTENFHLYSYARSKYDMFINSSGNVQLGGTDARATPQLVLRRSTGNANFGEGGDSAFNGAINIYRSTTGAASATGVGSAIHFVNPSATGQVHMTYRINGISTGSFTSDYTGNNSFVGTTSHTFYVGATGKQLINTNGVLITGDQIMHGTARKLYWTNSGTAADANWKTGYEASPSNAQIVTGAAVVTDVYGGAANYGFMVRKTGSTSLFEIQGSDGKAYFAGNVGVGTASPSTYLDINGDKFRVRTAKTPSSAGDTGSAGDICWDANYIYICTATNTWKRVAIATW